METGTQQTGRCLILGNGPIKYISAYTIVCGCGVDLSGKDSCSIILQEQLSLFQKFVEDVDKQGGDIGDLRTKASEILPRLSQHDVELVEENIR